MVLLQISPEILRMSSNRKMLGSKGILTPMIHGLLRISCSRNPTDAYELLRCEAALAILHHHRIDEKIRTRRNNNECYEGRI